METGKQITLREIASAAGVSVMTVSRALRNQSNLSPETRARVQRIAEELGYRPNPLVSALMSYRRAANPVRSNLTIAFLTNFTTRDGWRQNQINVDFFNGAAASSDRHGYKLEEFWLREPKMTARRLSRILYSRNVSGIIVSPLPVALGHIRMDWENFSAVSMGYSLAWPPLHRAVNHQFRSMRMALRRLRKMGFRRIGLALRASFDERVEHHWMGAFLADQMRMPPAERVPPHMLPDKEWNEAAFRKWFRKHRPDVVISQHEELLPWLESAGAKAPDDVGFVHLNCPRRSGYYTGIYQNGPAVGTVAVDFLVGMIQRNERGIPALPHSILVEGTWVEGETLKKP